MWIEREISNKIIKLSLQYPSLVLTGARQVGKTSLLRKLFPDHSFVSLDLPSLSEMAENNPEEFLRKYPPPVLIDEVQYAPALFRFLKVYIDQNRHAYGQIIMTGSQKFSLMKEVSESLAGRCAIMELEGLSLNELGETELGDNLAMRCLKGGFPQIHASEEMDLLVFYQSYLATYLERDIRSLIKVGQLRDFERFIRACAYRNGQLINKSDIARDVGISAPTANEWLSALQASNQIVLLEPWFSNQNKSMVKSPKLYFQDTGLLCYLLNIEQPDHLRSSPFWGSIFETLIFSEIRKRFLSLKGAWDLWFWRNQKGLEVDFLYHRGGEFVLIEAKGKESPNKKDFTNLEKIVEMLGRKRCKKVLCCLSPNAYTEKNNISIENIFTIWDRLGIPLS